ncbi:MAG TPA: DUF1841 family protein, partial [Burkholderiales bacterium]|nr:DUF1841 family protein [Burkholderiales bacterium]
MFNPSREEARRFFFNTWHKYKEQGPLTDLEKMALKIMILHPEYHKTLDEPERSLERDYLPEMGAVNPFLHMGMHLAIEEQLSIDQPYGIRTQFERILQKTTDRHEAFHIVMECLGEMIWHAQRCH